MLAASECPSSNDLGQRSWILERRAWAHRVQVTLLDADGSTDGFGWFGV